MTSAERMYNFASATRFLTNAYPKALYALDDFRCYKGQYELQFYKHTRHYENYPDMPYALIGSMHTGWRIETDF